MSGIGITLFYKVVLNCFKIHDLCLICSVFLFCFKHVGTFSLQFFHRISKWLFTYLNFYVLGTGAASGTLKRNSPWRTPRGRLHPSLSGRPTDSARFASCMQLLLSRKNCSLVTKISKLLNYLWCFPHLVAYVAHMSISQTLHTSFSTPSDTFLQKNVSCKLLPLVSP